MSPVWRLVERNISHHVAATLPEGGPKWSRQHFVTNPGTTPITILAVNSEHGLSFAGEETRTMV